MRDIVSCFSESSINVSNPSCSSIYPNSTNNNCIISPVTTSSSTTTIAPSPKNAVTSIYNLSLKDNTLFFVAKVTWSVHCLTVTLIPAANPSASFSYKLNLNSRLFRRKKGSKTFSDNIELSWDFTAVKFDGLGPEPTGGFYVTASFDSEIGLALGDSVSPARLVSRQEHCSGTSTVYATRVRFSDKASWHDIVVKCFGGAGEPSDREAGLTVAIDRKTVMRVKRLQWNFRGNQTIFVDGLLVDLLWDVHDWFFKSQGSFGNFAVFMFRTRSGMDSRLWLEEKLFNNNINNNNSIKVKDSHDQFSLLIYACKTSQ